MWLCSLPNYTELLESMGQVSGFPHTPKGSARRSALHRGPARAAGWPWRSCFYLRAGLGAHMPPLMLHEKLVGYKTQIHSGQWPLLLPKR